jgi:uncharacterized protein (TIGR02147 family)
MKPVFDYLDYRSFLLDFYESQKRENSFFSYRYFSKKVGLDAGYILKILQGKLHLPEKYMDAVCTLCKFSEKERIFFKALVNFNRAKSESQIRICMEKLLSLNCSGKQQIDKYQYEYYQKWYYAAIRSLIGIFNFVGDYESLSRMLTPQITPGEVKKAIMLLEKLCLIWKDESGVFKLSDKFITTGESWRSLAIKEFQRETIRLAAESLDKHKKENRNISTVTIAINKKELEEINTRITEFRNSILQLAESSSDPDCVFQLNIQLFPMAMTRPDKP